MSPDERRPRKARPARLFDGASPGNMGNSMVLAALAAGTSVSPTIIETPRNECEMPEVLTVTLGLSFQGRGNDFNPNVPSNILCNLIWGVGGAQFSADLDWVQGGAFSLAASYVRVGATYMPADSTFVGTLPPPAVLTASFAYGDNSNPKTNIKRLTQGLPQDLLPGGAVVAMDIPAFATSFTVIGEDAQDLTFSFSPAVGGAGALRGAYRFNDNTRVVDVPIPGGSWQLLVENNSLNPTPTLPWGSIIWNLGF